MKISTALGVALLAAATMAGKPASPSTTDPQVGYMKILSNGTREIRVSREDGTGSAILAKTRGSTAMALGPKSSGLIAYWAGTQIRLLKYAVVSTGLRTQSGVVIHSGASVGTLAFSPTGGHVAWNVNGEDSISVYDVATGAVTSVLTTQPILGELNFSRDGNYVIYSDIDSTSSLLAGGNLRFRSVPVAGGATTDLGIEGRYGTFGVGRTDDRLVADTMGDQKGPISVIPTGGASTQITEGYYPSFRCDDKYVIFQRPNGKQGVAIIRHELSTGLESTFSTSGNFWPEYFPDC